MPHLRFRGVESKHVQKLSENLHVELAHAIETKPENFTFEVVATQFFSQGKVDQGYPFIEVHWFKRSAEQQQKFVNILTDRVKDLTGAADIGVVFTTLMPADYFENKAHF